MRNTWVNRQAKKHTASCIPTILINRINHMSMGNISPESVDRICMICNEFGNEPNELINILHKSQETFGFLPEDVQKVIAKQLRIPVSRVYGVVTFYSFFTMIPKGKYPISICMGTACYVRGAEKVLDEFERLLGIKVGGITPDGLFSLNSLRCVGACGLAPVVMVNDRVYGRLSPDKVKGILAEYYAKEENG
jgi:NADH-quinone oxidoreductase subunit E/NADP-reducing hydrogenase subunit HndA